MTDTLVDILSPQRLTEIVDIGANPICGKPPYVSMLARGLCRVTGFEPQEQALLELQRNRGPHEQYLPYAVGDGGTHTLNICAASSMSSFLEPDPVTLGLFNSIRPAGKVIRKVRLKTCKLDDISEIQHMDFLKIDIQGGELAVFKSGVAKLSQAVAVQTEISFITLYKNQPSMGEMDLEMRRQGFIPHCFAAIKKRPIAPCVVGDNPRQPLNQLLEADIVYVRDFSRPDLMSDEQLKHLALIAHYCYTSFDLALRCVMLLEQRQLLKAGSLNGYLEHLAKRKNHD